MRKSTDWPLELCVAGGEVRRGAKFHGTDKQLAKHIDMLNSMGVNGTWDVDRKQLPDHIIK